MPAPTQVPSVRCATAPLSFAFASSFSVRVVMIDDQPWFVARDIAAALGYGEPHKAVARHCKRAKSLKEFDGMNHPVQQNQDLDEKIKLIPEPDVYRLIVGSNLPAAEAFEVWLFEEVLPAIRKTGRYQVAAAPAAPDYAKITRAQLDQLSTANSRAFTSWLFGAEGTQHGHNALRVLFSLRTLADLPAADFDRAMAETAWFEAACSAFTAGFVEARRRFLVEVIGNRAPWTPAQLRKMTDAEIKALPPRPDWLAIQAQLQLAKDAWGSA